MVRLALLFLVLSFHTLTAWAQEITVLGLFTGKVVLNIDGERRVLAIGERSPEGVRLLAADSDGAELEVGGKRQRYSLGMHIGSNYQAAQKAEVQIWPDASGMFMTSGTINGYTVEFMVDTGATLVSINGEQARRLGIDYRREGKPALVETASGRERAYQVLLDSVSVGALKIHNVPAVVLDGNLPSTILLGMSFLGRMEMERRSGALVLIKKW